jgi:phosphoribosyl-AMP cyclohydrolase
LNCEGGRNQRGKGSRVGSKTPAKNRQKAPICYIMVEMLKDIKFNKDGLVPAIAQDADTGEVLMLAYMNEESLRRTLKSGQAWFWSRSRQELWHKGETSGNIIKVREVWKDCDSDTILIKGKATGPVCHTGNKTCFFQELTEADVEG